MPQSLVQNYIHIVFSTKGRKNLISSEIGGRLYPYLYGISKNMNCYPKLIGGHLNHVHILCDLPKTVCLSKLIEQLKSSSSKWLKTQNRLDNFAWQNGYAAFSIQYSNVSTVVNYIANQEIHHQTITFENELRRLLKENALEFDERYLWD
ncbi:MAG: IS200/IS605 family transposase [Chryseolinea sp.]